MMLLGLAYSVYSGFHGPMSRELNPGIALLWSAWWPLLAFLPYFIGRGFCGVCPVMFLGPARTFLARLDLRVPESFHRLGFAPAAAVLLLFSISDQLLGIEAFPWVAARFTAAMLILAAASLLVFDEWVWCRQLCPVGAVQAVLARFSLLRWTRSPKPGSRCTTLGLGPRSAQHLCTVCGDCWRSASPPRLAIRPRWDPNDEGPGEFGELLLMSVLLAHVFLELLVAADPVQAFLLQLERGKILWLPLGQPPAWLPRWPLQSYLAAAMAGLSAAVIGLRALLRASLSGEARLRSEEARRFGLSLLPLTAAAYAALHVPSILMLPELAGRFYGSVLGAGWSAAGLFQATAYPAYTVAGLRLVLLSAGTTAAWMSLLRTRTDLASSRGEGASARYRAELAYLLLLAAALAFLMLLPSTQGDPC